VHRYHFHRHKLEGGLNLCFRKRRWRADDDYSVGLYFFASFSKTDGPFSDEIEVYKKDV
jgi:hypothetical protein